MPTRSMAMFNVMPSGIASRVFTRRFISTCVFSNQEVIDRRTIDRTQVAAEMADMLPQHIGLCAAGGIDKFAGWDVTSKGFAHERLIDRIIF